MIAVLAVLLATQDPQAPSDAYRDPGSAHIVASARAQRARAERLVTRYQATVTQRIGAGLRALRRDRTLFGQELAARIDWRRDGPSHLEVLGARQRVPIATRGDEVPEDLDDTFDWLVFDPASDLLRFFGDDADGFVHPLRPGAERDYRYASGDTTVISLPGGRTIRVVELRLIPRRAEFRLMSGSLWFDADTYGLVRAIWTPARPFDIELDGDSGDADDVPFFVKPVRAEVRYITLEYGLYESRWWMPRYFAVDAEAQASVMRMPLRLERTYADYRVEGGSEPTPGARRPAGSFRSEGASDSATTDRDSLARAIAACVQARVDSAEAAARERGERRVEVRIGRSRFRRECRIALQPDAAWPIEVVALDTAALLRSPMLGEPILQMGDVLSEHELENLAQELGALPQRPWQAALRLPSGVGSVLRHARYNRIEALSLGVGAELDLGRLRLDAVGRLGIADLEPGVEVGLTRPASWAGFRLAGYRRLAAANPETRPFGVINSFSALLLGRDDGEYFRALGVELAAAPAPTRGDWWRVRTYAERQRPADVETDASLPRAWDGGFAFRPNIVAEAADQIGAVLALRGSRALGPHVVLAGDVTVEGSTGTFDFGRYAVSVRATLPLGGPALAVEAAAGTSSGTVPVQGNWFLGGPATLRGYAGGVLRGEAFWRGRLEVATASPAVRLAVFSDAGWAGPRPDVTRGTPLVSVGAGISVLDGLLRLDLAQGLRHARAPRFDFYVDGVF